MSRSYVTEAECDEYLDELYRARPRPDVTISVSEVEVQPFVDAIKIGKPLAFCLQGFDVHQFHVIEIMRPIDELCRVTLRPTNAPKSLRTVVQESDTLLRNAVEETMGRIGVKIQRDLERALFGPNFMVLDDPYATKPASPAAVKSWFHKTLDQANNGMARRIADQLLKDAKLRVPIYTGTPMCRCVPFITSGGAMFHDEVKTIEKAEVKSNRFYVGSKSVFTKDWGHEKLADAVAHATELLEERDGEEQFVVQIVRVVRRKPQPIVVETVK